jgi:hypothetical protein
MRRGEKIFAELLPAGDWRLLATGLYTALRHGLAHGSDTRHLHVDGLTVQIFIFWNQRTAITLNPMDTGYGVYIGAQPMVDSLCREIDNIESLLQQDEAARHHSRLRPSTSAKRRSTRMRLPPEGGSRLP